MLVFAMVCACVWLNLRTIHIVVKEKLTRKLHYKSAKELELTINGKSDGEKATEADQNI